MHILAAFDKCKDSLSAREICALGQKVASAKPFNHDVHCVPLTDGGEGFFESGPRKRQKHIIWKTLN